jgi:hypothetical protein
MAKNYTIAEAVRIIVENGDNEALMDLGKRYPLLTQKIARVAVKAGEDFADLMSFMPEYLSANKVNSAIKKMLDETPDADSDGEVEDDGEDEAEEKPVKKTGKRGRPAKVKKVEEDEDTEDVEDDDAEEAGSYDYDSMNNAKLYKLLGDLGKRKECKEKFGDLSKASMLKYLKKYGPKSDATGEADDEDDTEESGDEYEGKSAVELYKLCKQRKIKAEQKKPAKYYIGLLKKADEEAAAEAEADDAEDDEEWDDDEEETPKKPAKKAPAKGKKPVKKAEPEEADDDADDDDEWEI